MFDSANDAPPLTFDGAAAEAATLLTSLLSSLEAMTGAGATDHERIEQIGLLERLKGAAAAAQARISIAFERSQRAVAQGEGVPVQRRGEGIAEQIALARRESPHAGRRHLGLAHALTELPETMAALTRGRTSEWRATIMARETALLSREHRALVDAEVGSRVGALGDREVAAQARAAGYRLDPHSLVDRIRRAESDRRVTLRPAADTMTQLTGLLPLTHGVAVYAALKRHADTLRGAGDERTIGQLMADALVARVTGLTDHAGHTDRAERAGRSDGADDADDTYRAAGRSAGPRPSVEVQLVMTDRTLFGDAATPGWLVGAGIEPQPVPGWLARRIARTADEAWLRRLYTAPETGELIAADVRRRHFSGGQRQFLIARDRHCRTPWCGAPIQHADHVVDAAAGGPTSLDNGAGLCARCNLAKQAIRWRHLVTRTAEALGGRHQVTIITPAGHVYRTEPPLPPGGRPPHSFELHLTRISLAADYARAGP